MPPRQSLSTSEVDQFAREGYLVRFGTLTPPMIAQLLEMLEALDEGLVDSTAPAASTIAKEITDSASPSSN